MTKKKLGLFLGTYSHEVASGGRVTLPSRFKVELSQNQIIMIKAPEGSILCFDTEQFVKNTQKYMQESTLEPSARAPRREIFNNALTVEVDDHGRFVIPEAIRQSSEISDRVTLAGIGDAFEIWPEKKSALTATQNNGSV